MKWTDIQDIAFALVDKYPDKTVEDVQYCRFTDLREWVIGLVDFDDDPEHSNEKILEAIQAAWLDELE